MEQPKRVLCIMDLSVVGRSSMAVVLPVLAACGVQACPLPTSLFSAHTGGFGEVYTLDAHLFCEQALRHYQRENVAFDAIYVGYLLGEAQFALAEQAMRMWPKALKVVDPSVGDGGKIYSKITPAMVGRMADLCRLADLITPNYTESALLLGERADVQPPRADALHSRMARLAAEGRQLLVTSVPRPDGGMEIWGCGPDGRDMYTILSHYVPQRYPGTGDLFAAAVTGLVLRGLRVPLAARQAAAFDEAAVNTTYAAGGPARQGVWFEPHLGMLAAACEVQ